jgi:hypothetical protein
MLNPREELGLAGGAEGGRTPDLLIANEALSQLSYGPARCNRAAVDCEFAPFTAGSSRSQGLRPPRQKALR